MIDESLKKNLDKATLTSGGEVTSQIVKESSRLETSLSSATLVLAQKLD